MEHRADILDARNGGIFVFRHGKEFCVYPRRETPPDVDPKHWDRLLGALHVYVRREGIPGKPSECPQFKALKNAANGLGRKPRSHRKSSTRRIDGWGQTV